MRSEGYVLGLCVSVCLSVCYSAILALQGSRRPMSDTNVFRTTLTWKKLGDFPKTTVFESDKLARSRAELRGPTHQLAVY